MLLFTIERLGNVSLCKKCVVEQKHLVGNRCEKVTALDKGEKKDTMKDIKKTPKNNVMLRLHPRTR